MIAWLVSLFVPRDLGFRIGTGLWPEIPPETRVRVDEGEVGTIAGFREGDDGRTRARVVFAHPIRRTWIEDVSLHRLSLAIDSSD